MLADSALYSTSPWQQELFFNFDSNACLETDLQNIQNGSSQFNKTPGYKSSVASSDCSEDLLDGEDTFLSNVDNIDESLLELIQGNEFCGFDLEDSDIESVVGVFPDLKEEYVPPSPKKEHKKKSREESLEKPWKKLTSRERLSALRHLEQVVGYEMGLREQLDVIRIVNPAYHVSPTDTEFTIDFDKQSEDILEKVYEYVGKYLRQLSNSSKSPPSTPKRQKKFHSKTKSKKSPSTSRTCQEDESEVKAQKILTKKEKAQRKAQLKVQMQEAKLKRIKDTKQSKKEKKSGLFRKEEVHYISSANTGDGIDEDIDILD